MKVRAPQQDGERVCLPAFRELPAAVAANRSRSQPPLADWFGSTAWAQLAQARHQTLAAALEYTQRYLPAVHLDLARAVEQPLIVGGHQPQLFHPGVWLKNFVLSRLAERVGGVALNLVVDSDLIRSPSVPILAGSVQSPQFEPISFDAPADEMPWESRAVVDQAMFRSFGARVEAALRPWGIEPLAHTFWPRVVERAEATGRIGLGFAQARHQLEADWGNQTLELPLSMLCRTPAFVAFVAGVLRHAPQVAEAYNGAVRAYRAAHRLRNAQHPVPDLDVGTDRIETPFWGWRHDSPQRKRLFIRAQGQACELVADHEVIATWDSQTNEADKIISAIEQGLANGWCLRTRALTTTLFARMCLGDLFVHGIGGGKYDEVTDTIIRWLWGVEPPHYAIVSGTMRLPLAAEPPSKTSIAAVREQLWRLQHQPERALRGAHELPPEVVSLLQAKRRWLDTPVTGANNRARCRAIRQLNGALQGSVAAQREALEHELERCRRLSDVNRVIAWREFAFIFYQADELRHFLLENDPDKL